MKCVKLYDGCFGVTRIGEVVGPMRMSSLAIKGNLFFHESQGLTWNDGRAYLNPDYNITKVFNSRESAEEWLAYPWWKRLFWRYFRRAPSSGLGGV